MGCFSGKFRRGHKERVNHPVVFRHPIPPDSSSSRWIRRRVRVNLMQSTNRFDSAFFSGYPTMRSPHEATKPFTRSRPCIADPGMAWSRFSFAIIGLLLICFAHVASAQPVRFNDVKAWRGTFIAKAHQYTSDDLMGRGSLVIYYDSYFTADFLLDEFEDEPAVWRGRI